ncbi:MAG: aldehyde dehydrogenase family protein [Ignavibacteria bacterium]|nr:aldehyde dehydrogenase family protein [Ignavibacteria bacterium]MBK7446623.1 aldehyde dehydrogenase family protein [Ignavibacteria bacterium]MBK9405648.1 aldehyde dehydrogenase family protein [Ignavibacteria bacterium]MBL0106477.1 aldehyde dehydrogenase family protein [Ignavibacteria bacterium]
MEKYLLYINGEFRESSDGKTFDAINPANGEVIAKVSEATIEDTRAAIKSARDAFDSGVWSDMPGEERSRIIKQIVDKINENAKMLTKLEVMDSGSTIRKAGEDIFLSAKSMNYFSKMAAMDMDENIEGLSKAGVSKNIIRREPVGVAALIIPWNFPLKMAIWKIGPALAAGCCVILKPAQETSLTACELAKLIDQTDIPKGVVNVITGKGSVIGTELVSNPDVDKVGFTGSTDVGKIIMKNAAVNLKKITLECGGKSANIVLDDADIDMSVDGAVYAAFYHQGQCCEGGTRLLVQEKIYDEFIEKLKNKISLMKTGDPMDKTSDCGPVVNKKQFDSVMNYIKIGKEEGAEILTGGKGTDTTGFYIEPTVFINVNNKMRIAQEEIFGPVLVVIKFSDDDDAVRIANDSIFGLGGAVWSGDDERAMKIAKRLRTGTVWINEYHLLSDRAPFGGYKQSGIGREFGPEGIKEYTEAKHIHIDEIKDRSKKFWYDTVVPKS